MKPSIRSIHWRAFAPEQAFQQMNAGNSQHRATLKSACSRLAGHRLQSFLAAALLLSLASSDSAAVGITAFNNSVWPRSDASMGLDGFVIEDFEDVTLAPGLQVQVQSPSLGGYGPVSTLPFTFDPSQDLAGSVFNASLMWDGTRGLVNRPSVPITSYGNDGGWSDVSFLFAGGVTSLGFSYGQADDNVVIGIDLGLGFTTFFNSSSFLPGSSGRNGYLRIDAGPGEIIYGVKLDNQAGNHDGILYDHLAFKPVPSANVPDASGTGLLLAAAFFAMASFCRIYRPAARKGDALPRHVRLPWALRAFCPRSIAPIARSPAEGNVSGWIPAAPIIAAGTDSLVTMVSGGIAVFSKQGAKLFEQNLGAGDFWLAQGGAPAVRSAMGLKSSAGPIPCTGIGKIISTLRAQWARRSGPWPVERNLRGPSRRKNSAA